MIKVLMISTDTKIFEEGTPVRFRMIEYGKLFAELHIVVFSLKSSTQGTKIKIGENTFVYPTHSLSKFLYIKDGEKIGCNIIHDSHMNKDDSVITTQDPFETGHVGRGLSKRSKIPLHVQIHTDFYNPYFRKSVLNKIRITLSKKVLPQARAIRVVSEKIKQSLPSDLQKKVSVLPIFVDMEILKATKITADLRKKYPQFKKIALVASRLTKEKDISTTLKAFKEVSRVETSSGLIIVGSGSQEVELKKEVKRLGINTCVVFESWASYETLISYMKTCDVFLSSSLYEGYGLSMLEAHTAGATLVATNAGIAPLLVSKDCLVEPGDIEGLKTGLLKAFLGNVVNKPYIYPYTSKKAYFEAYKADIERALL